MFVMLLCGIIIGFALCMLLRSRLSEESFRRGLAIGDSAIKRAYEVEIQFARHLSRKHGDKYPVWQAVFSDPDWPARDRP